MWYGGSYLGLPSFNLDVFCQKAHDLKATDMHLVPPIALLLTNSALVQKYDLSSVRKIVIAAAPLKVR